MVRHRGNNFLRPWEVSLAKAMMNSKEFSKQQVLAYFTRPNRSLNLREFTQIARGEVESDVPPATADQVRDFLARWNSQSQSPESFILADPLSEASISQVLIKDTKNNLRLSVSENHQVEFKKAFTWQAFNKYAKTIAGFANSRGGYLFFGVEPDGVVAGIDLDFWRALDPANIHQRLNTAFVPSLGFEKNEAKFGRKDVGVIFVREGIRKPIFCIKGSGSDTKEGEIYFRYSGATEKIKHAELETIIIEREQRIEEKWLRHIDRIKKTGVDDAVVLNPVERRGDGAEFSFVIDEDLARSLKVIKEGEFNELVGAPTLKLIGNLQAANSDDLKVFKEVLTKDNITEGDIISDFATHRNVRNPKAYIRQVCHLQARWLPIYYFASLAGLSLAQLEQEFSASQSPYPRAIEWQINRVKGNRFPPHQGNQPALGPILSLLAEQKMPPLENINDARRALKSLRVMVRKGLDHEFAIKVLASVVAGFLGEQEIRDQLRYASSLLDVAIYRNRIET